MNHIEFGAGISSYDDGTIFSVPDSILFVAHNADITKKKLIKFQLGNALK